MVHSIGIDVVDVERIKGLVERWGRRFLQRLFCDEEQRYLVAAENIAARIAAKEAVMKVLSTGRDKGVGWRDIVIEGRGPLMVRLKGEAEKVAERLGIGNILVSISHDGGVAVAVAVGVKKDDWRL